MPSNNMDDDTETALCQFCKDNVFKYVCPRCNLPYCSVSCYQSQAHSDCSEEFYKQNIQDWLKAEGPDADSKKNMMEILKKFQNQEQDFEEDQPDSDDEGSLTERLAEVNLDDADEVWNRLLPEEKQEFLEMLKNGDITKLIPEWEPWWNKRYPVPKVRFIDDPTPREYVEVCPKIRAFQDFSALTKIEPAPQVYFNVVNVLASYVITGKYYNGDLNLSPTEATATLCHLSKNLSNNQVFEDFDLAIESVTQSVVDCPWVCLDPNPKRSELLAEDVSNILHGPNDEDSSYYAKAAISHMIGILNMTKNFKEKPGIGEFSGMFNERSCEAVVCPSKETVTKSVRKLQYYLSWTDKYLSKFIAK